MFWTLPDTDLGRFRVAWQNTFVNDYEAVGANGIVQPQAVGIEVNNSAIPEWSSNLALDWIYGDFTARWTTRHIDGLTEDCGDAVIFPVCGNQAEGTNDFGSTTYHDVQVGWRADWMRGVQFTVGANNVFDRHGPPMYTQPNSNTNYYGGFDIGRFVYMKYQQRF